MQPPHFNLRPTLLRPIYSTLLFPCQCLSSLLSCISHSYNKTLHFRPLSSSSSSSPWFPLLRTAISTADLLLGKSIHAVIITAGDTANCFLTNNLITMYSKCCSLSSAHKVFDRSPDRDLITWNSILAAYAISADLDNHNIQEGFRIFRLLLGSSSGLSVSKHTLAPVLNFCLISGYLWASEMVHGFSIKVGLGLDLFISGALVNIYCKFGQVKDARVLFDDVIESDRDAILWNVMLKAYVQTGLQEDVYRFFSESHRSRFADAASVRYFLSGFPGADFDEGEKFMHQVQAYATKLLLDDHAFNNVILRNRTLSEHHHAGENMAAVECYLDMNRPKVGFDNVTFVIILATITDVNNLELGQQIHGMAFKSGLDIDVSVANSLINMYSKTDGLISARKVFANMEELDLISWNSMIASYVQNGLEEESVTLFVDLLSDGLRPDHFTLASVLKACSLLAGLSLSEQIHVRALKTGVIADNFVCTALIDVYSRNRRMNKAEFLLQEKDEFDFASWNAVMSGYIVCGNSRKALEFFALMCKSGEELDKITFATAAKACSCLIGLEQGSQIHAYVVKIGLVCWLWSP